MKTRMTGSNIARVVVVMIAFLPAIGIAQAGAAQGNDPEISHDAVVYAADQGLSYEEALRRLAWQEEAVELDVSLSAREDAGFAGLEIVHSPSFKIIIYLTEPNRVSVSSAVATSSVANLVEFRVVPRSLRELESMQSALLASLREAGFEFESNINLESNQVEILVLNEATFRTALSTIGLELESGVTIIEVDEFATPVANIYGALSLTTCTSGFGVRQNSTLTKGITTAGHCQNSQAYSGTSLPYQAGQYSGSTDLQWHTAPGFTVKNWVHDGIWYSTTPYYRTITSIRTRANQSVGELVCKYGMSTYYECGYIQGKNYAPTCVPSATGTYIVIHRDGVDLANGGDSGAPAFRDNAAYGTVICEVNGGVDALYMAPDYFSSLGLSILTAP